MWKSIVGFSDYEISDCGMIRKNGKLLKQSTSDGYKVVTLFGKSLRKMVRVHRLVALHFLAPPETIEFNHVAHNDGSRDNNAVANLRWATCKGNLADRVAHGTTLNGIKNGRAKLSPEQVMEIRKRYKKRHHLDGAAALGKEFGVTDVAIIKAYRGENWSSVPF